MDRATTGSAGAFFPGRASGTVFMGGSEGVLNASDHPSVWRLVPERDRATILWEEHCAGLIRAGHLKGASRDRFLSLVGHAGQRLDVGGIGIHPITPFVESRTFELADSGPTALILPVRPAPNARGVPLIDLAAWLPRTNEVYRRLGIGDLLGEWAAWPGFSGDRPVTVSEDPGSWARANGESVFLLDWNRAWSLLSHLPALAAPTVAFGRRLQAIMEPPPVHRPVVYVPEGAGAHE